MALKASERLAGGFESKWILTREEKGLPARKPSSGQAYMIWALQVVQKTQNTRETIL